MTEEVKEALDMLRKLLALLDDAAQNERDAKRFNYIMDTATWRMAPNLYRLELSIAALDNESFERAIDRLIKDVTP